MYTIIHRLRYKRMWRDIASEKERDKAKCLAVVFFLYVGLIVYRGIHYAWSLFCTHRNITNKSLSANCMHLITYVFSSNDFCVHIRSYTYIYVCYKKTMCYNSLRVVGFLLENFQTFNGFSSQIHPFVILPIYMPAKTTTAAAAPILSTIVRNESFSNARGQSNMNAQFKYIYDTYI